MSKCPKLTSEYNMEKLYIEIEPTTSEYGMAVKLNGVVLIVKDKESILEEVLSFLGYEVEVIHHTDEKE